MKYFTKELWLGYNDQGPMDSQTAIEQGRRNMQAYIEQLEKLRPRLAQRTNRFFSNENLHDGRLLAFIAGDAPEHDVNGTKRFDINAHSPLVIMKVLGPDLKVIYTLRYKKVRKISLAYPSDEQLFHKEGNHIGDWGYDELTAADEQFLRHEILFASGTIILVEFKAFSYRKERFEGNRFQGRINSLQRVVQKARRR
jgi:hypothetical protein